jgi:hypothetical protein
VLEDAEVRPGDIIEMRFRVADQDHVDVPDALQGALESDPSAMVMWTA